jgi:hypothetical protein
MENLSEQQQQPDQIIAYIAFEATTTRTFLTYAVILLFSLGILMVLVTDEKNENGKKAEEVCLVENNEDLKETMEVRMNTNEIIVEQITEVSIPEQDKEEITVSSSLEKEPELEPEIEPIVVMESLENEGLKEEETPATAEEVLEPEVESVVVMEPVIQIDPPKTPKRRQTRHHEITPPSSPPLPMSPRRSERKVKKPVLFDPSRR